MENKKQSSIDWLIEQISYKSNDGQVITFHKNIAYLIEQAKAKHKEEIESAWEIGCDNGYDKACDNITWDTMDNNKDNYYNETFGGNNE